MLTALLLLPATVAARQPSGAPDTLPYGSSLQHYRAIPPTEQTPPAAWRRHNDEAAAADGYTVHSREEAQPPRNEHKDAPQPERHADFMKHVSQTRRNAPTLHQRLNY